MKIKAVAAEGDFIQKVPKLEQVGKYLRSTKATQNDFVLLFGTKSIGNKQESLRERSKLESFTYGDSTSDRHLATQWIDLTNALWGPGKNPQYAMQNVALAAVAKLGHVPFGISAKPWFKQQPAKHDIAVIGYDVCHLLNFTSKDPYKNMIHISAGTRVSMIDGNDAQILGKIEPRIDKVDGESVPEDVIRKLLSNDLARGRIVIVHRDGRFSGEERETFHKVHRELAADGTSFVLVEIVKWQGGTPRLYSGSQNVADGTMVMLSDKSVILASSGKLNQGTVNPLWVRLVETMGKSAEELDDLAWARSVFELSYLHHGSLYKAPRLPITTYFADRMAKMVADGGKAWDETLGKKPLNSQQFWL